MPLTELAINISSYILGRVSYEAFIKWLKENKERLGQVGSSTCEYFPEICKLAGKFEAKEMDEMEFKYSLVRVVL